MKKLVGLLIGLALVCPALANEGFQQPFKREGVPIENPEMPYPSGGEWKTYWTDGDSIHLPTMLVKGSRVWFWGAAQATSNGVTQYWVHKRVVDCATGTISPSFIQYTWTSVTPEKVINVQRDLFESDLKKPLWSDDRGDVKHVCSLIQKPR